MIDHADPEREVLRQDEVVRLTNAFTRGAIEQVALYVSLVALGMAARDASAEIEVLKMMLRKESAEDVRLDASRRWLNDRRGK